MDKALIKEGAVVFLVFLCMFAVFAAGEDGSAILFDRDTFVSSVKEIFAPLELLLPEGDAFDYERTLFFSGVLNGVHEHIITLPLTTTSRSMLDATRLGQDLTWDEVDYLVLCGIYVLPPNDCIKGLDAGVPYLVRAVKWDKAEVVDCHGNVVRFFTLRWTKGAQDPEWIKYAGDNELYHAWPCIIISTDQS